VCCLTRQPHHWFCPALYRIQKAGPYLQNLDRLKNILNNQWKPVQIIFSGKAHPADDEGKRILQRIFTLAHDPELGGRIAFVENYDEQLAQYMVHGVDLWLNNPLARWKHAEQAV